MRSLLASTLLAIAAAGVLGGCGGGSSGGSKGDVNTAYNKALNATILVDGRGRSLYVFGFDTPNTPTCYDDVTYHCSKAWPPLLVSGAPKAGKGVDASLLKTVKRKGGALQVAYNRQPLYTFAGYHGRKAPSAPADKKPGDLHGQNYVGAWWVVSPAGRPIKRQPSGSGY